MTTEHKLDALALAALACLVIGEAYIWTWYLQLAFWAVFLTFWGIICRRWYQRKRGRNR
jgi:membrane protein implicated in regulation of membrane protease activity